MSSKSVSNTLYNDGFDYSFSDFHSLGSQNPTINLFNNSEYSNDVNDQNQDTLKLNPNENQNENFSQEKQNENKSNSNAKNTKKEKKNIFHKKRNRSKEEKQKKSQDKTINNCEKKKVNKKNKEIIPFYDKLDEKDDDETTLEKLKKFIVIILMYFIFNQTKKFHINKYKSIYDLTKEYHKQLSENINESKNYFPNFKNIIEKIYKNSEKYPESRGFLQRTPYQCISKVLKGCKIYKKEDEKKELRITPKSISNLIECLMINLIRKEEKELKSKDNKIQSKAFIDLCDINNNIQNRNDENISNDYINNNFDENININNINEEELAGNNTKTKCTTNLEEIEKVNRKDNLFNVFKTMIKKNNEIESDSIDDIIKDLYKKKNEKFNLEHKDLLNWIKIKDFLTKEIKLEEKNEENIFKQDKEEQKKYYKNLKCKNEAVQILISLNLDGLIILQKLVTVEKKKYIKIKNSEEFERIIKEKVNPYFSLNLTYNEKNDISGRKNQLIKIAKKILTNLEECFKINEVAIELNLLNN